MKFADLNKLSDESLVHHELRAERELVAAQLQHSTGQLEDSSRLAKLRKDIARARTVQRAREAEQGLDKDSLRSKYRGSFDPTAKVVEEAAPTSGGFLKGIADRLGLGAEAESST